MPEFDTDVVVVGLGAWGSSALWRLAARGVDVVGIERFGAGHGQGSSHGETRLFRVACQEHPDLVPLARRAGELWRDKEIPVDKCSAIAVDGKIVVLDNGGNGLLFDPKNGKLIGNKKKLDTANSASPI